MDFKIAIFGLGYFGSFHLKTVADLGYLAYGIDINPGKKELVENFGGKFLGADLTKAIQIKRDKKGNPLSHKIQSSFPGISNLAKNTNAWDIVTSHSLHFPLMLLGLELKKEIFIEKPPAERVSEIEYILRKFPKAKIAVDYLEIVHPVVLAIKEKMKKEKFHPFFFLHHRSKDLRGTKKVGLPVILDELVHDLSEVNVFKKDFSAANLKEIKKVKIKGWQEIGYPFSAEAKAKFTLYFKDKGLAEIEGSYADPAVRQFLIADRKGEVGFYGSTLRREKIKPTAAKLVGKKNIEYLKQKIKSMEIIDNDIQNNILKKINADILEIDKYNQNQLSIMLQNFLESKSKKDLICSLERALEYQKIAERVRQTA